MTQQTGVDDLRIVDDDVATVTRFLQALERADLDAALDLVAEDLVYENVSLPTIRGRRGLDKAFRRWMTSGQARLRLHVQHIATDGDVVMTDRIDEIGVGRFATRFWVYGRFTVRDGKIAIWRDHFDWYDITAAIVRGALGLVSPALNRPQP